MANNSYNFDILPERRQSESIKWRLFEEDVLPMWVADMDFYSPPEVTRALQQRVQHGLFGYGGIIPQLMEVTAGWIGDHYSWKVEPDDLLLLPGVVTGFNLASRTAAQPGEAVIIQTPVYPPFLNVCQNQQLFQQQMELTWDSQNQTYSIDFDIFNSIIDNKSKVFLLCNPHNPTGRVFQKNELEKIGELCLRNGIMICSDEIHCDLVFSSSRHIPIASLSPELEMNSITLIAPSKTFNIPGLDCSFAIIKNPEIRKKFNQAKCGLVGGVNILGQVAGYTSYKYGSGWLSELLVYLEGNRDYLMAFLKNELPQIRVPKPEGTYLGWLDCKELKLNAKPCEFFLDEARLGLMDGTTFGPGGENFVRLNFGCPRYLLIEGLKRMKTAIEKSSILGDRSYK